MPAAVVVTGYNVELRDKEGNLKTYLTPFVSDLSWEWNRIGGCGRCSITIKKPYRDILFDVRDDIQIRIEDGTTSKLVYRGFVANVYPTLKIDQEIRLDVRGYYDLLKKLIVHDTGDTKTYGTAEVGPIADDIIDTYVTPNTPITIAGALAAGDFEINKIDFLCTVDEALNTLAEIQGDIEYGVDEDLVFYWITESSEVSNKFIVGDNISVLERTVKWDNLVNKLYLIGGQVADVRYKYTAENTDSQGLYGLFEEIINKGSITTDTVSIQYLNEILIERSSPKFSSRAVIKNTDRRIEDTIPLGAVTFYDPEYDSQSLGDLIGDIIGEAADGGSDITIGVAGDGGSDVYVGGQFSDQIERISYSLSNTPGRFNITIQLGDTFLDTAAKIKRMERMLSSIQQGV